MPTPEYEKAKTEIPNEVSNDEEIPPLINDDNMIDVFDGTIIKSMNLEETIEYVAKHWSG